MSSECHTELHCNGIRRELNLEEDGQTLEDTGDVTNRDVIFCERGLNAPGDVSNDDDTSGDDYPDGGWGWVVVGASLMFNIIYDGCSYSFGILYTELLDHFQDSKGNTAWIGSLFFAVPLLCGPISAKLSKRIGARLSTMAGGFIAFAGFFFGSFANSIWTLVLCYGLISGFGMSIPYFNSTVVIAKYFNKRRACATGIAESGAGVGTLIFAPIVQLLVSTYGWRGALLILSGIVGNVVVCGALYRPLPIKRLTRSAHNTCTQVDEPLQASGDLICTSNGDVYDTSNGKQDRYEDLQLECYETHTFIQEANANSEKQNNLGKFKTSFINKYHACKKYYSTPLAIFMMANFIMYFWYDVPYVFLMDYTRGLNIPAVDAALLLSIIGLVHTGGILLYGYLGDIQRLNTSLLFGVSIAFCGVSLALVPVTHHYPGLAALAGLFGLTSAATEALVPVVLIQLVGIEAFDTAFGMTMCLEGVANLTGPPFAGLLADVTGLYDATFYAAGLSVAVIGSIYALLPLVQKIFQHRIETEEITV